MRTKLFIFLILLVLTIIILLLLFRKEKYTNGKYTNIFTVKNMKDFQQNFLLDNPNGDGVEGESGSDPTGGAVDYSFMFEKNKDGSIIPNENGDTTWQNIPDNAKLISEYENGIKIELDDKIINGVVGAPRLISKKLFKGGLFVFDVEHIPVGCTVWPAIWTNGFVGKPDQYHAKKGTKEYEDGIEKLAKSTKLCGSVEEALKPMKTPEPNLSEYLGKDVYVSMWPSGGEIDIVEQTNFRNNNLFSVHSGASCEVGVYADNHENNYMVSGIEIDPQYKDYNLRSGCGATFWPDPNSKPGDENYGLGPYSGCATKDTMIGEKGGTETRNIEGDYRYNCPQHASTNAGNTQVIGPNGSFGPLFNENGGGVFVMEWDPNNFVNMWFFPAILFPGDTLTAPGKPLSESPDPSSWTNKMTSTVKKDHKEKVLIASYKLNDPNAITQGCDFNYQSIIINITLGGGWGGSSVPKYCTIDKPQPVNNRVTRGISSLISPLIVENYSNNIFDLAKDITKVLIRDNIGNKKASSSKSDDDYWRRYIKNCYNSDTEEANKNKGTDPNTKCYDGSLSKSHRGSTAKPVFFSEAYFKIRSISVFQKDLDNVW
jgi:hypothetical protein